MRCGLGAAAIAAALPLLAGCAADAPTPNRPVVRMVVPDDHPEAASVEVSGLNDAALRLIGSPAQGAVASNAIIRVDVLPEGAEAPAAGVPPMAGRVTVEERRATFTPSFPFDPATRYRVTVDATSLPGGAEAVVSTVVSRPAVAIDAPPVTVTAVAPGGDVIPENVLRLYVHFSAPMARRGAGHVRLLDAAGKEVVDPFLPLEAELWSGDHTRYTLFFDPGRVKTGIKPNEEMGRALVRGRRYTLVVDADWKDAYGRPLAAPFRHRFRAGPAIDRALDMEAWRLAMPVAGTRDALVVTFPYALDEGLLARTLTIETTTGGPLSGAATTGATQTTWRFVPARAWQAGAYSLVALPILEDPSGNRVTGAFEVAIDGPREGARVSVPFMIAR